MSGNVSGVERLHHLEGQMPESARALSQSSLSITAHLQSFRRTRSLASLMAGLVLVVRQNRTIERLYGIYCRVFHRASSVFTQEADATLITVLKEKVSLAHRVVLSRQQLIQRYGTRFGIELLPPDFESARAESIWQEGDELLIIGEYGEGARLALITCDRCVVNEHYQGVRGVRHIHSVERYGQAGEFLVATGDSKKFLDLWEVGDGELRFIRRLRKHLAGFTAAVQVHGDYYFGTDFSSRPNYIMTLQGTKYFFPPEAYNLFVTGFHVFLDRYIVAVNNELMAAGGRRTLSLCSIPSGEDSSTVSTGGGWYRPNRGGLARTGILLDLSSVGV
jgi:hypothetical protein